MRFTDCIIATGNIVFAQQRPNVIYIMSDDHDNDASALIINNLFLHPILTGWPKKDEIQ